MYDILYNELAKREKPIDIILVGFGFMGLGFLTALTHVPGMRVPLVISRRPQETVETLIAKGYDAKLLDNPSAIKDFAADNGLAVSDNLDLLTTVAADVVFEVTGTVAYGADAAVRAIKARKHLVTMNPELQATVGTALKKLADQYGVIITDVIGDQPGSLTRLIGQAKMMGFTLLLAGNMKRYLDIYATQEKMQPWANDKGLAVKQTTSFTDGTKQAIEMNLVANYYGMDLFQRGMVGPEVTDVNEALEKFDFSKITGAGVVDYVIGRSLFPGIFVVAEHNDPHQQKYLRYLGLGEGPRYILFEPYHLCHLEVPQTIAKVVLFATETINNGLTPTTQTVAIAKRDLAAGETLDGIGGDMVYGVVDRLAESQGELPVGLAQDAVLLQAVKKDQAVRLADVTLPKNVATDLLDSLQ